MGRDTSLAIIGIHAAWKRRQHGHHGRFEEFFCRVSRRQSTGTQVLSTVKIILRLHVNYDPRKRSSTTMTTVATSISPSLPTRWREAAGVDPYFFMPKCMMMFVWGGALRGWTDIHPHHCRVTRWALIQRTTFFDGFGYCITSISYPDTNRRAL